MNRALSAQRLAGATPAVIALIVAAGCGDAFKLDERDASTSAGSGGAGSTTGTGGDVSGESSTVSTGTVTATGGGGGGAQTSIGSGGGCAGDPTFDDDGDFYSEAEGDCDDCNPDANPGGLDIPDNGADDDCSGGIDDAPPPCDDNIPVASNQAADGARAIGLCQHAGTSWGVIDVGYVRADGTPINDAIEAEGLGHGILPGFGPTVKPQEGQRMLAISSGTARRPGDQGFTAPVPGKSKGYESGAPDGYPKQWPACGSVEPLGVHDSVGLRVSLQVPTNARSLRFDFNFYASDYPDVVCDPYNDFFVPYITPWPRNAPDGGLSFDAEGNAISVNADILRVCAPVAAGADCSLGPDGLLGSGFDLVVMGKGASSGWMRTTAPVDPGSEITLLFAIWDSGDGANDSTTLVDNVVFEHDDAPVATTPL